MKDVLIIIVLYRMKLAASSSFLSLQYALKNNAGMMDLLVYDNSPETDAAIPETGNFRIHYVNDPANGGISKAYNYGANYARGMKNKKWLLFADQDTVFPADIFEKYALAIQNHPGIKLFAPVLKLNDFRIFSPCRYRLKRGFLIKKIKPGIHSLKTLSPVNSGMLVNLDAFFNAGGYNENIRLDFSDFQFISRFKKRYPVFGVIEAVAVQDFSNDQTNISNLNIRYSFFCEGARNCERENFSDNFLYFAVAFMRATTLALRTRKLIFYKTFLNKYLLEQ